MNCVIGIQTYIDKISSFAFWKQLLIDMDKPTFLLGLLVLIIGLFVRKHLKDSEHKVLKAIYRIVIMIGLIVIIISVSVGEGPSPIPWPLPPSTIINTTKHNNIVISGKSIILKDREFVFDDKIELDEIIEVTDDEYFIYLYDDYAEHHTYVSIVQYLEDNNIEYKIIPFGEVPK